MTVKLFPWQEEALQFLRILQTWEAAMETPPRKCSYNYTPTCGDVVAKVRVTVYVSDPDLRETSKREMCLECLTWLTKQPDNTFHSIRLLGVRCTRTSCQVEGPTHRHTQTGKLYCAPCANRINQFNPNLVVPLSERMEHDPAW